MMLYIYILFWYVYIGHRLDVYHIILIYTLYTWVASHRFCCRTCHVLRHGSKLPSIRRPLLRIRSTGFVTRKRPRSDSVLADRRTGFWLLSCGSLSSLGSLATCESASCTTSALWILLDGLWWFVMVYVGHYKQTIITIIYWWFIMAPPWFMMVCHA